jgi:hypothetical protein
MIKLKLIGTCELFMDYDTPEEAIQAIGSSYQGWIIKDKEAQVVKATKEKHYTGQLFDADPTCKHVLDELHWDGIKCKKCGGWFCY